MNKGGCHGNEAAAAAAVILRGCHRDKHYSERERGGKAKLYISEASVDFARDEKEMGRLLVFKGR